MNETRASNGSKQLERTSLEAEQTILCILSQGKEGRIASWYHSIKRYQIEGKLPPQNRHNPWLWTRRAAAVYQIDERITELRMRARSQQQSNIVLPGVGSLAPHRGH